MYFSFESIFEKYEMNVVQKSIFIDFSKMCFLVKFWRDAVFIFLEKIL